MGEYTAILKGYQLDAVYSDGSESTETFKMDELEAIRQKVDQLFAGDLDYIQSLTVKKIWSKPGETVSIPVKYQS